MRPGIRGLPTASLRLLRRLIAGSVSGRRADDEAAKCPESLCPILALPPSGRRTPPPRKTLLLRSRLYGLMRRSRLALPYFGFCLVGEVFAGCYQPLLPPGSSRRYLCQSFPRCLDPYHDGLQVAFTCCFPCNIGLPQKSYGSACRDIPLKRLRSGEDFRGRSHFFMFRPPDLLATLVAPTSAVSCGADGDFYVRARHALFPPHAPDMLAVRNRQLTARGLAPRQTRSLVGRSALSSSTPCRFNPGAPPHFFPATALSRGLRARSESFLVPPSAPACA
jgi:hypothetical protein